MKTIIEYINWMRIQGKWPAYLELIVSNNLYGIIIYSLSDIIDINFNTILFRYNYKFFVKIIICKKA